MVEPLDDSIRKASYDLSLPTGAGIVIDIGTGDGLFVSQSARENPAKFYIGIDANTRPLEKISERIHRKPMKGGLPNVLFLEAAVENLPEELDGVADDVHIHFFWGSLLRAVACGDLEILKSVRRICSPDAVLEVLIGLDPEKDRSEWERLEIPPVTTVVVDSVLSARYLAAGFRINERGVIPALEWPELQSSWAKRLKGNPDRALLYLIAQAI